jgi:hypothetical protein
MTAGGIGLRLETNRLEDEAVLKLRVFRQRRRILARSVSEEALQDHRSASSLTRRASVNGGENGGTE